MIPTDAELYFIVSMLVFLIRPSIKYLLTKWKYKVFPILGMLLYFLFYIQEYTFIVFVGNIGYFIQNIWIYFVIFTSVIYITQYTFRVYDKIIGSIGYISKVDTIPYSIIIFMGFVSVYFFDLNLLSLLREIYFPRI